MAVFLYTRIGSDGAHQSTYYLPITVLQTYPALLAFLRAAPRIVSARSEDLIRRITAELLYALSMGPEEPGLAISVDNADPTKKRRTAACEELRAFKARLDRVLTELGFRVYPVGFDRCALNWPAGSDFPWLLRLQRDPPFPPVELMVIEN